MNGTNGMNGTNVEQRDYVNGHSEHDTLDEGYICREAFERVWIGISGCDTPKDAVDMRLFLTPFFPASSPVVTNDAVLLSWPLRTYQAEWGIAVVSGTGSIVLGLQLDRSEPIESASIYAKMGGYGHLFGDAGSGYHMGLTAIEMAARDYDLGVEVEGGLAQVLRKEFGVETTGDVPARAHDLTPHLDPVVSSNARKLRIARLAPHVLNLAQSSRSDRLRHPQSSRGVDQVLSQPAALHDSPVPLYPHPHVRDDHRLETVDPNESPSLPRRVVRHVASELAKDILAVYGRKKQHRLRGVPGLVITGGLGSQAAFVSVLREELEKLSMEFAWVEVVADGAEKAAIALSQA